MPRSIAITSGKGGVGKSCIALNLAVSLARMRKNTLLVDGDLGLGNIALLLGASPEETLENVLAGECTVEDARLSGPEGLTICLPLPIVCAISAHPSTQGISGG